VRALPHKVAAERGEQVKRLADEAWHCSVRHPWPGNVREWETAQRRAIFAEGSVNRL